MLLPAHSHRVFTRSKLPLSPSFREEEIIFQSGQQQELPRNTVYVPATRTLTAGGPETLQDETYRACLATIVDASAGVLQSFVQEDRVKGVDRRIGQLTLSVSVFGKASMQSDIKSWLEHPTKRASLSTSCRNNHKTTPSDREAPQPLDGCRCRKGPSGQESHMEALQVNRQRSPAGFDVSVWEELPSNIRMELCQSEMLRQQQHGIRGNATGLKRPAAARTKNELCSTSSPERVNKRKAAAAGCASIQAYFSSGKGTGNGPRKEN